MPLSTSFGIWATRFITTIIGKIVSSLPAVQFGKLHYRDLERNKIQALKNSKGNYEATMTLSLLARELLNWWVQNTNDVYRQIQYPIVSHVFFRLMQAIVAGGITSNNDDALQTRGMWSQDQAD